MSFEYPCEGSSSVFNMTDGVGNSQIALTPTKSEVYVISEVEDYGLKVRIPII